MPLYLQGGVRVWELAFMGLPSMIIIQAENQELIAESLGMTGGFNQLGVV